MKKIVLFAAAGIAVVAIVGVVAFQTIAAKGEIVKPAEVSHKAAEALQRKIDAIRKSEDDAGHKGTSVEISETELESYLLYSLQEEIPAKVDAADVQLAPDTVALDTQITFASNATGNTVVDTLVGGTHNLFLRGGFVAKDSRGKFDLQEVRVDGIPVPNVLIEALIKRYVTPKYPDVNLKEPFDMPWGIEELKIEKGKAIVVY
jgi:hypothetical protein